MYGMIDADILYTLLPSPSLAFGGLVSGGFLLGIGFASVKQLFVVDIGFTPLSFGNPYRSLAIG
jgi:hypothetical protein